MLSSHLNPSKLRRELQDAYLRYVDFAFWLRHPSLMSERRGLLERKDLLQTYSSSRFPDMNQRLS